MENEVYVSYLQWMPKEILEDLLIVLASRPKMSNMTQLWARYDSHARLFERPRIPYYSIKTLANSLFGSWQLTNTEFIPAPCPQTSPQIQTPEFKLMRPFISQFIRRCPSCKKVSVPSILFSCFKKMHIICGQCLRLF